MREAREDGATLRIVNMAGLLMTSITRQQSIDPKPLEQNLQADE